MCRLKVLVIEHDVDVVWLIEINKDWYQVEQANTIWNGNMGWKLYRRIKASQNATSPSSSNFQVGGTTALLLIRLYLGLLVKVKITRS